MPSSLAGGCCAATSSSQRAQTGASNSVGQAGTSVAIAVLLSNSASTTPATPKVPSRGSRILTRELLYTGVTRARKQLTVIATADVVRRSVLTPVRRATGLADRLREHALN